MKAKTCTKCGEEKLLDKFYVYNHNRRGRCERTYTSKCKACTIKRALNWYHKNRQRPYNRYKYYTKEQIAFAVGLYGHGMTCREVAKQIGTGSGTVSDWAKEAGVLRTKSEATKGEKHWRWQGGKAKRSKHPDIAEYREWRMAVYVRDGFKCVSCGNVGGKLNAHHILGWAKYPKYRYVVANGSTLCEDCHKLMHKKRKKLA